MRDDFQDVAVVAGDVVAFEHAGMLFHLAHARLVADVVTRAIPDRHERRHRQTDLAAIELDAIAADIARLFEAFDALHDGGSGEANFRGDGPVTRAAGLSENAE